MNGGTPIAVNDGQQLKIAAGILKIESR
jgi:hypothetical protein